MLQLNSQSYAAPMVIEPLASGDYQVSAEGGESAQVVNEAEVNQLLASHGLKMVAGVPQSVDNFAVTSGNAGIVTSFGDAPDLPDMSGTAMANEAFAEKLNGRDFGAMSLGSLTWMALSEMSRSSMRDLKDAKDIRNSLQQAKYNLKGDEIAASKEKIAAEKQAAWTQFGFAMAGAALNVAGAAGGLNQNILVSQALGQSLSQVVTTFGTALDKSADMGGQATADKKQIEIQKLQQEQEAVDMAIDDARSTYEESKEQFKHAQKLLTDYVDRQSQIVQTITR